MLLLQTTNWVGF